MRVPDDMPTELRRRLPPESIQRIAAWPSWRYPWCACSPEPRPRVMAPPRPRDAVDELIRARLVPFVPRRFGLSERERSFPEFDRSPCVASAPRVVGESWRLF